MNYTTLLKDPHNRQVIKAMISLAKANTVNKDELVAKSNKTPNFVFRVLEPFKILNQLRCLDECGVETQSILMAHSYVFNTFVITDLIAGLKELGFSPE